MKRFPSAALLPIAAGLLAALAFGSQGVAANAAVTTVSGTTAVSNHADGGHGTPSTWAYDDFNRGLTVTLAATSDCTSMSGFNASTDNCYDAVISDNGRFNAILGAGTPSGAGGQISHSVSGNMVGNYDLTAYAPATDTLSSSGIPASRDDNFGTPTTITTNWPTLAFTNPSAVVVAGGAYTWTYTSACEKWTDSSSNSDGTVGAGNITGVNNCVVYTSGPVLFQNVNSGKCLNVLNGNYNPGGTLNQYTCNAMWHGVVGGAQRFRYYVLANGMRFLEAMNPDNSSTIYVQATVKGANLSLTTTPVSYSSFTGGYISWDPNGTRLYMDVQNYSKANLASVHGWTMNNPATANQQWHTLTPA